jgi:nucleoside-diphosphate-sugar epimerase
VIVVYGSRGFIGARLSARLGGFVGVNSDSQPPEGRPSRIFHLGGYSDLSRYASPVDVYTSVVSLARRVSRTAAESGAELFLASSMGVDVPSDDPMQVAYNFAKAMAEVSALAEGPPRVRIMRIPLVVDREQPRWSLVYRMTFGGAEPYDTDRVVAYCFLDDLVEAIAGSFDGPGPYVDIDGISTRVTVGELAELCARNHFGIRE